jgi:hypothetical protein
LWHMYVYVRMARVCLHGPHVTVWQHTRVDAIQTHSCFDAQARSCNTNTHSLDVLFLRAHVPQRELPESEMRDRQTDRQTDRERVSGSESQREGARVSECERESARARARERKRDATQLVRQQTWLHPLSLVALSLLHAHTHTGAGRGI